jgi:hypothetical protein
MNFLVEWNGPDKRYVIATYPSHWTWDDFDAFKIEVDAMIQTVPYEVGAIADVSASGLLPKDASQNISKAFNSAPANMGLVVNVGANRFLMIVTTIVRRLAPRSPARNLIFVATMDEAHALMNERYPTSHQVRHGQNG